MSILLHAVFKEISVHELLCSIDWSQLSHSSSSEGESSFPTYLVDPVSYLSGEKPAPIIDVLES